MSEPIGPLRTWEESNGAADELHNLSEAALADASSVASRRMLGKIYERELDELATPEGSSALSDERASSREEEERKREEKHLMAAVARHAANSVAAEGLSVARVVRDGETVGGGGYVLSCRDREGRQFDAHFGLELAHRLAGSGGTVNLVERMGLAVARAIREERHRYFKRMESAPVPTIETGA